MRWCAAILLLGAAPLWPASSPPSENVIIQRSVQANQRDWQAAPQYDYMERDQTGKGTRTDQVSMILGTPYRRLVAIDRKPLLSGRQAQEQRKMEAAMAGRQRESPGRREARVASYRRERHAEHLLIEQLTEAFDFRLVGQRTLDGRPAYLLQANPRPGYNPPNRDSRVLRGMQGELWIDAQTYQWMKVTAVVIRPVQIVGLLARVEPGTSFELEYRAVMPDIWLPVHYAMKATATVLGMFRHAIQDDESYYGYQKAGPQAAI
jgi:hypothetical protein